MFVSRWGNSLALRIPKAVVDALKLKEGDEVRVEVAAEGAFRLARDTSRDDALAGLDALARPMPPGWSLSRREANER